MFWMLTLMEMPWVGDCDGFSPFWKYSDGFMLVLMVLFLGGWAYFLGRVSLRFLKLSILELVLAFSS